MAETLWLPRTILNEMVHEADRVYPRETGGVWMGYRVEETSEAVVTAVVGPGPFAIFRENEFTPDAEYQLAEIDQIYHASGRLHTFLGDWHSHPKGSPYLSPKDVGALKVIARTPEARQSRPITAIIAGGDPWRLVAWRYRRAILRRCCAPMTLRLYDV